jgi:Bacterial pre-peptidase C-terminal domain
MVGVFALISAVGMASAVSRPALGTVHSSEVDDTLPGVPLPASPVRGVLTQETDTYDFYSVLVKRGQRLTASLTGVRGTDFDLFLLAPGSTMDNAVKLAESKRTAYPDTVSYKARTRGTYYVLARTYTDTGSGSYKLAWTAKWDNTWATSVSLSMTTHRAKLNVRVPYSGAVKPADAGAGRSVLYQVLEGRKWKTLWTEAVSSTGRYGDKVYRTRGKGVRYYRVVLPAGFGYKQAISRTWAITYY